MFQPNSLSEGSLFDFVDDLKDQLFKNPEMTAAEIIETLENKRFYKSGELPDGCDFETAKRISDEILHLTGRISGLVDCIEDEARNL